MLSFLALILHVWKILLLRTLVQLKVRLILHYFIFLSILVNQVNFFSCRWWKIVVSEMTLGYLKIFNDRYTEISRCIFLQYVFFSTACEDFETKQIRDVGKKNTLWSLHIQRAVHFLGQALLEKAFRESISSSGSHTFAFCLKFSVNPTRTKHCKSYVEAHIASN